MLAFTQRQFDVLGRLAQQRFEIRMVAHLRATFADRASGHDDAALRRFASAGIALCRPFGVVNAFDVQRFLEYLVIYGPDFVRNPDFAWARQILLRTDLSGSRKMDQIDDYDLLVLHRG